MKDIKVAEYINDAEYIGDGIITSHNINVLKIEEFAHSYANAYELVPVKLKNVRDIAWRSRIYSWA